MKEENFNSFAEVVRAMRRREHLTVDGFERIARIAFGMNANGKQRSRTLEKFWRAPQRLYAKPVDTDGEDIVRPIWRHMELGRNDLATQ